MDDIHFHELNRILLNIEDEISKMYRIKQHQMKGVKSLGNEIRYSRLLQNLFSIHNNLVLSKATFNRGEFLIHFLKTIKNNTSKDIYFFLYDKEFNKKAQLVDKTSTTIQDVRNQLKTLLEVCSLQQDINAIYFVEVTSFTNNFFEIRENGYSRIHSYDKHS